MNGIPNAVLEDDEIEFLIASLRDGQPNGFSEDDVQVVTDWAETARIDSLLLEMVFKGDLVLSVSDREICFNLSPQGERRYNE